MVEAEEFKDVCDRVERSTVNDAAKALRENLSGEMDVPVGEVSWKALSDRVETASRERKWKLKEAKHLVDLLRNRAKREDWARRFLDDESAFKLYRKLENRSPRELATFIAKKFQDEGPPLERMPLITLKGATWDNLFNFIRAMKPWGLKDAGTLYSVLLFMRAAERRKPIHAHGLFTRCSRCWRPVPSHFMGNGGHILCQFHTYQKIGSSSPPKRAYERGLELAKADSIGKRKKELADGLYGLVGRNNDLLQDPDWLSFWDTDPCKAEVILPYVCQWPEPAMLSKALPLLGSLLPREEDFNPAKIVEMLTPTHPLADPAEAEGMAAYHSMWRKNFFLFVPELAHAEAWLEACKGVYSRIYFPG